MTKDEKPIIDSDGVARHRSNSRSSHTSTSVSPINERRPSLPSLSPSNHNLLTIDVELSKKRKERDGEDGTPGTPLSATSNSSFLMTPQFGPTEPSNQKRRLSLIESLASKEDDNNELKSLASVLKGESEDPFPWYKNTYDLSNFPIPQQEPITVFPIQFASYQVPNTNNNNTPQQQGNETPTTLAGATSGQQNNVTTNNGNNVSTDPNLSSMRTGAAPNSTGNNQSQSQNQDPNNMIDPSLHTPEIRFPDAETLASATASPSRGTGDVGNLNLGDASTQAALAAVSSNTNTPVLTPEHAAALLQPPSNQIDQTNIKKDQPFSRSPELRVSHKLAERKRRKEMKELFDELRDELPSDRGMKASKWEILSKAIDHVRQLKTSQDQMLREIEHLRREVDIARGGTGAYTHAYATTYNIPTTTYPPQNNFTNPSNNAANSTNNQQQQQQQQQQAVQNVQAQSQQQQAQPQSQVQQPQQQQIQQQPQQQQLQQPQQQNVQQNQDQTQQQQQQPQTVGQVESMQIDSKPTQ
ncbi:uncharacterized protein L201_005073 [Kwoniella dendrophila CBS 6074]|uniref:BHLH domain-containing protein n=1 Tax=Kwoniella dendrophila CBS 6074 TaxID=1295534 RepID=A0AAX4K044_9TREE